MSKQRKVVIILLLALMVLVMTAGSCTKSGSLSDSDAVRATSVIGTEYTTNNINKGASPVSIEKIDRILEENKKK